MKQTAWIFPGQGSQYVGMGRDLYEKFEIAREVFDQSSQVLGWDVASVSFGRESDKINLTEYTQPAILVVSVAAWKVLFSLGNMGQEAIQRPRVVAGHSLGEYTAIVASEGMDYLAAVSLVQKRGRFMQASVPEGEGLMAAILGLDDVKVQELCLQASLHGTVAPANYNSPGQVVIAGSRTAVEKATELAKTLGAKRVIPLPVSVPSHCPLMEPAAKRLTEALAGVAFRPLVVPLVTNVDAQAVTAPEDVRRSLSRQVTHPVRWAESVARMIAMGCDQFIEIGPGRVLSGLVKRIAQGLDKTVTLLNVEDQESLDKTMASLS